MADEPASFPDGFPDLDRLHELTTWVKNEGGHDAHARDVRSLLRMIEYLQEVRELFHLKSIRLEMDLSERRERDKEVKRLLPIALRATEGIEDRIAKVESEQENLIPRVEAIVAVATDDINMFKGIAERLLGGEPVSLDQLTSDEREWVEFIPQRTKR